MKKKINEEQLVEMIQKDNEYQAETLRLSKERTEGRIKLITGYDTTMQNFYIRKKKYEKAMSKDFSK